MLCESLKKKAVLVFSVSMGNRLEIDLARIIIIIVIDPWFRKQNRPRGLSVYNRSIIIIVIGFRKQNRPRCLSVYN